MQIMTDALTGLLRRNGYEPILARLDDAEPVGVVLADLDRFKEVNDRFGHPVGEMVLIEIARRVAEVAPPNSIVGRSGGDEFVVFLPGTADITVVQAVAVALLRACDTPVLVDAWSIDQRVSVGVAIIPSRDLISRGGGSPVGMDDVYAAIVVARARGGARAVCRNPEWEAQ